MSETGRPIPRAVLDSNVIFSRVLHELVGRAAGEARLFDLVWSDELLTEAKRESAPSSAKSPSSATAIREA